MYRQSGYIHYRLDTWAEMNEKMLKSQRFGMQLIKHFNYKPILDEILQGKNSPQEKMEAVYDFVSQSMKWNGMYAVKLNRDISESYENKDGSGAEINMLMVYLLKKAGLRSDPVLIRTNDLGMPETVYPAHNQFNHHPVRVNPANRLNRSAVLPDQIRTASLSRQVLPRLC